MHNTICLSFNKTYGEVWIPGKNISIISYDRAHLWNVNGAINNLIMHLHTNNLENNIRHLYISCPLQCLKHSTSLSFNDRRRRPWPWSFAHQESANIVTDTTSPAGFLVLAMKTCVNVAFEVTFSWLRPYLNRFMRGKGFGIPYHIPSYSPIYQRLFSKCGRSFSIVILTFLYKIILASP